MVGSFSNFEESQYSCLPPQWKSIHPVFHISLLEPVKTSAIPNQNQEPPPSIIIEEEEELGVSKILDSKLRRRKLWYLVEWKGFSQDSERSTWESAENPKNCPELVKDFHSLYPDKQGPNSSKYCIFMPQRITLLHWCCGNSNLGPSWGQLANLAPSGALWHFAISLFPGLLSPQAISCHHWPPWPILISPTVTGALLNEEGLALREQTYLWRAQKKYSNDKSNG
ncbi:hypothetical protein O181_111265, partial [Austropuccinia psidii MF-1]|nr:hypothetical protein [Austropuccinia psidii MF-1]